MVTFNGVEYELTSLDSIQTIKLYIASHMRTAVHYLFFPDGFPEGNLMDLAIDVTVVDLSRFIIEQDTLSLDDVLSSEVSPGITLDEAIDAPPLSDPGDTTRREMGQRLNLVDDVVKPFISTNIYLERAQEMGDFAGAMLLEMSSSLEDIGDVHVDAAEIWADRDSWKARFRDLLEHVRVEADKFREMYREFGQIRPDTNVTDFVQERLTLTVSFDTEGVSLMELMNAAVLTPQMPFISYDRKYKVLMGEIPPVRWSENYPNALIVQVAAPGTVIDKESGTIDYIEFTVTLFGPYHNQKMFVVAKIDTYEKSTPM